MAAELTIHFIRNYTAEPIANALTEGGEKIGLKIVAELGAYENLGAEIAALAESKENPPFVFVTIDLDYFSGGIFSPRWSLPNASADLQALFAAIDALPAASFILLSTFLPPFRTAMPFAPGHPILGKDAHAWELNRLVREFVAQRPNRCGLIDFERIALRLGESATLDRRFRLMMKSPFKAEFAAAAAGEILRFFKCRFLPLKKVLVLDCDNTLWGGVIGETGVENIQLDPYEYPGIAYHRFQSEILAIAEKGFLICLCSKNDEAAVWEAFEKHPYFLLRRNLIAAHRINWSDKANNLKELALELNLSLDSMVFVDDNPAECELIRSQFPEVTVLQVPAKIYELPGLLAATELFDRIAASEEDQARTHYYQAEKGRRDLQTRHVDAEGFLRDLEMKAIIRPVQSGDLARAAQLCQRTNQFNLTNKRHAEADLALFLADPSVKMFLLQAEDRFGAMGNSGLIILKKTAAAVEVDTFLMSCRIIGRKYDVALFCEALRQAAKDWQFTEVRAGYLPSQKNSIVAGLWNDYGFAKISSGETERYVCPVADLKPVFPAVIRLEEKL